jgi:CBS domain-containing protein
MKSVGQLLKNKGHSVFTIDVDATVLDAIKLMAEKEIGALIVTDKGTVAGVLSERDYARQVILKGRASDSTAVREIMTSPVISAESRQQVQSCMELMSDKRIRHLPIIDDGELVGVISMGDIVKSVIAEQQHTIEQLEHYVTG